MALRAAVFKLFTKNLMGVFKHPPPAGRGHNSQIEPAGKTVMERRDILTVCSILDVFKAYFELSKIF